MENDKKTTMGTIYVPIGTNNVEVMSDAQLIRLVHRNLPRQIKVNAILDTFFDKNHSACTVELVDISEEIKDSQNEILDKIFEFTLNKVRETKLSKNKAELKDILNFINELKNQ